MPKHTMHKRELDAAGNFLPDKRLNERTLKRRRNPRFITRLKQLRTMASVLASDFSGDTCTLDFVGTLIQWRYGRTYRAYVRSGAEWKPTNIDKLAFMVFEHDTGEHIDDVLLYTMIQAGCGRRELFNPHNPPTLKTRKPRSDKGHAKPRPIDPGRERAAQIMSLVRGTAFTKKD